jgi:uncharacterized membrane protein
MPGILRAVARAARAFARRERALLVLVAMAAIAYAVFSLQRHMHFASRAFDLGIFDQTVWHYSRLEAPESTLVARFTDAESITVGLPTQLGDHFSPILALLAPLYWAWPDPRMLLVAQAILIAASAVPVFLYAEPRLGRLPAYLLAASYLLFWGISSGVEHDFHETAFAPLLVALAILFADRERLTACYAALALLLLTKENMAVLVVFFGLYLTLLRRPREGLAVAIVAVAWYALVTEVLMPALAGGLAFRYWTYSQIGDSFRDAVGNIITNPVLPIEVAIEPVEKVRTALYMIAPFLGLILFSPLLVLAVPLVAERMLSTNENLWTTEFHYTLVIAPILAMGAADGLRNVAGLLRLGRRAPRVAVVATSVMLVAAIAVAGRFPVVEGLVEGAYTDPGDEPRRVEISDAGPEVLAAREAVAVPPAHHGSVAAANELVPHLSARSEIFLLRPGVPDTDYIVYQRDRGSEFPFDTLADRNAAIAEKRARYRTVFDSQGVVVLERRTPAEQVPRQHPADR